MKKRFGILLSLAITLSLVACSNKPSTTPIAPAPSSSIQNESTPEDTGNLSVPEQSEVQDSEDEYPPLPTAIEFEENYMPYFGEQATISKVDRDSIAPDGSGAVYRVEVEVTSEYAEWSGAHLTRLEFDKMSDQWRITAHTWETPCKASIKDSAFVGSVQILKPHGREHQFPIDMEIINMSADDCSITWKATNGKSTINGKEEGELICTLVQGNCEDNADTPCWYLEDIICEFPDVEDKYGIKIEAEDGMFIYPIE